MESGNRPDSDFSDNDESAAQSTVGEVTSEAGSDVASETVSPTTRRESAALERGDALERRDSRRSSLAAAEELQRNLEGKTLEDRRQSRRLSDGNLLEERRESRRIAEGNVLEERRESRQLVDRGNLEEKQETTTRRTSLAIEDSAPSTSQQNGSALAPSKRNSILDSRPSMEREPEAIGRSPRRQWGNANAPRNSSLGPPSESGSLVDDIEAAYLRDILKKKRATKESLMSQMGDSILGDTGVPEFHAGLKALRIAVQEHELPMRLAYEQLDELAANAERVKAAIEKNRSLLSLQIRKSNLRYLKSAFTALAIYTQNRRAKKIAMKKAAEYFFDRMLKRAFTAWWVNHLRHQKFRRLQLSAEKFLRRTNLGRIWRAWYRLVKKRLRDDERHRREKQLVKDLQVRQREGIGRRAFNAMKRRRLARVFHAFQLGLAIKREIQRWHDHIYFIMIRRKASQAFLAWAKHSNKRAREMRAVERRENKLLYNCFVGWEDEICEKKYRRWRMNRCHLSNALACWIFFVTQKARHRKITLRITRLRLFHYFNAFRTECTDEIWRKNTCKRAKRKCDHVKQRWFFQAWICYMQMQAHKRMLRLEDYVALIEKENERSRSECDRLGRIVDSGDWDKQRVMDLEAASQVLCGERDALTKLVGRMEREHAVAMDHTYQQEEEINLLKNQIVGSNFMTRNKILVRGASSFNSVVRAVKSEVLKKGVDPEVVYSIDKMAMDRVCVFPDGDLRVKSLNKFDKGKWVNRSISDATKAFIEHPPSTTTPRYK